MGLIWLGPPVMEAMLDEIILNADTLHICQTGIFSGTDVPYTSVTANSLASVSITGDVGKSTNPDDTVNLTVTEQDLTTSTAGTVAYYVLTGGTATVAVLPASSIIALTLSLAFSTPALVVELSLPMKFDWLHADVLDEALDYLVANVLAAFWIYSATVPDDPDFVYAPDYYSVAMPAIALSTATKSASGNGGRKLTMDNWQSDTDNYDNHAATCNFVQLSEAEWPHQVGKLALFQIYDDIEDVILETSTINSSRYRVDRYFNHQKLELTIGDIT